MLRRLLACTALIFLSLFSPLYAAEKSPLPPAIEARIRDITKACVIEVAERVVAVERAGGIPHFFVHDADGRGREVSRTEFIEVGAYVCTLQTIADDPMIAPYLVPVETRTTL